MPKSTRSAHLDESFPPGAATTREGWLHLDHLSNKLRFMRWKAVTPNKLQAGVPRGFSSWGAVNK